MGSESVKNIQVKVIQSVLFCVLVAQTGVLSNGTEIACITGVTTNNRKGGF